MVAIGLFAVASTAFAATPSVISVKLTGSNILTVIYSEPVTTNSWDYTNFTGNGGNAHVCFTNKCPQGFFQILVGP